MRRLPQVSVAVVVAVPKTVGTAAIESVAVAVPDTVGTAAIADIASVAVAFAFVAWPPFAVVPSIVAGTVLHPVA